MEGTYEVALAGEKIGKVCLTRWGLYYEISCRCRSVAGQMLELVAQCNGQCHELGLLAPVDGGLGLDRRIPAKRLGEGVLAFFALPREREVLVSVRPEEPFAYLQQLQCAYLVGEGEQMRIGFRKNKDEKREK